MKQSDHNEIPFLIGVLGGTLTTEDTDRINTANSLPTPFGEPSAALQNVDMGQTNVAFMARHGLPHAIAPHDINYRANLWTLYEASVSAIVAMYAVGAIGSDLAIGDIVIPDPVVFYYWAEDSGSA